MTNSVVKKAYALYQSGDFEQAKALYQQLNKEIGKGLFELNIKLCDNKRLLNPISDSLPVTKIAESDATVTQLAKTQQQLEHYYALSQSLKLKLAGAHAQ